ncbi:MAG TPA: type II toxin-antitoxin system RelE/ParE family toxin [Candidatus Nanoarchaeia archaeon]|nr:type II toxin-antitoxin system RelE/ParE family toxin [Candidatus Nanoarchaeia archaeon]
MYSLEFVSQAERFLKKLEKKEQLRIDKRFSDLQNNPKIGKPLVGRLSGLWSLKIGDYRAIYQIKHDKLIVLIIKIGYRKNVYD